MANRITNWRKLLQELENIHTNSIGRTVWEILTCLYQTYGKVTPFVVHKETTRVQSMSYIPIDAVLTNVKIS